ncbi:MAG: hypothetical protein ACKVOK_13020, partial [Flavobacteriales bacterium]
MKHSTMFVKGGVCSPYALVCSTSSFAKAFILSLLFVMYGSLNMSAQSSLLPNGAGEQLFATQDGGDDDDEENGGDDDDCNENNECGPFKVRWNNFSGSSTPNEAHDIGPKNHIGYIGTSPSCPGHKSFWTGGYYGGTPQTVVGSKTIHVPSNATQLNFLYNAYDGDNVEDGEYSYIKINGTEVYTVSMSDEDATNGYVEGHVNLSAYAGQWVTFTLGNTEVIGNDIGNVFYGCFNFTCASCEPVLEVSCPSDIAVECGDENNFDITGYPTFEGSEVCEGTIEVAPYDVVISSSDCGRTILRTFTITLGDLSHVCTQLITVTDTQGPVFPELENIYVQCLEEVPGPLSLEAYDVCSEASAVETFTSQTGEPTDTCVLSTAFGPGADWAVWLPVLAADSETSSANFVFDSNGGHFDQFFDGTA